MTDRIRVLHVDDDASSLEIRSDILEEEYGFEVVTAETVGTAKDRLAQGSFDCVLSDLKMPGEDGFSLLAHVRDEYADLPFILFTSHETEDVARKAFENGATDYLPKSIINISYDILAHRIRQSVAQYGGETDGKPDSPSTDEEPDSPGTDEELDRGGETGSEDEFIWVGRSTETADEETAAAAGDEETTDDVVEPTGPAIAGLDAPSDAESASPARTKQDGATASTDGETASTDGAGSVTASGGSSVAASTSEPTDARKKDSNGSPAGSASADSESDPIFDLVRSALRSNGHGRAESSSPEARDSISSLDQLIESAAGGPIESADSDVVETEAAVDEPSENVAKPSRDEVRERVEPEPSTDRRSPSVTEKPSTDLSVILEEIRSSARSPGTTSGSLERAGSTRDQAGSTRDPTDSDVAVETAATTSKAEATRSGITESHELTETTVATGDEKRSSRSEPHTSTEEPREPKPTSDPGVEPAPATDTTTGSEPAINSSVEPEPATDSSVEPEPATDSSVDPEPATDASVDPEPAAEPTDSDPDSTAWDSSESYHRPEGLDIEPGDSVLVECGSQDDREDAACADLLGIDDVTDKRVLLVRYRQMNGSRLERIATSAEQVKLVSVGYTQPVPNSVRENVDIVKINNPNDAKRLGIIVTSAVSNWQGLGEDIVLCLHPLNVLLQYKNPQSVFRFLHILLGKLRGADVVSHFHVDPSAGDPQDINTLKPLFDAVISIDSLGAHLETQ